MILYDLKCHRGHAFEAWFLNGGAYDSQQASGDVLCPHCGTTGVSKAPMAPNIARSRSESSQDHGSEYRAQEVAEKILKAVDGLRAEIEDNCDFVGDEFAEEARRIHYGESEKRGIYGEATEEEAEELDDEGVEFFRLPTPRRRND
ncbi:MAG: DUF1178 family protein [Proteobacteria bacterium]|nr:DUF1178 family protein [Pseudomonadota bacterium]